MENKRLNVWTVCLWTDALYPLWYITFLFIFEMSCRESNRRNWNGSTNDLKAFRTHLANVHISSHQPSQNAIKTLRILKKLKKNKDIAPLKPDKRNGMVILDRTMYANRIMNIISNSYKGRSHLIHFTIRTTKTKFCTSLVQRVYS